jgi:dGTPase
VKEVRIWSEAAAFVRREYGDLPDEGRRYYTIRCIIDDQVKDVVHTSEQLIRKTDVASADDVRKQARPLIRYSTERRKLNLQLRKYLYRNYYYHPAVHEPNLRATRMMRDLFGYFLTRPKQIGEFSRKQIRSLGLHRAVCDYIAGMTDLYLMKEHERIFDTGTQRRA